MSKPKDADFYAWSRFVQWAQNNGVDLKYKGDWQAWWECWKAGYCAAMNA